MHVYIYIYRDGEHLIYKCLNKVFDAYTKDNSALSSHVKIVVGQLDGRCAIESTIVVIRVQLKCASRKDCS
jgi:hypothetical protein